MRSPAHPGRLIKNELDEMGLDVTAAAASLSVTPQQLDNIINGKLPVTPEIATRLEQHIGSTAEAWLRMQAAYDSSLEREWMDAPDVGLEKYEQALIGILDGSGSTWGVRIPDLPGCHGAGATPGDAVRDAASAAQDWIAHQTGKGLPIPLPRSADAIMADPDVEFRPDLGEIAVVVA